MEPFFLALPVAHTYVPKPVLLTLSCPSWFSCVECEQGLPVGELTMVTICGGLRMGMGRLALEHPKSKTRESATRARALRTDRQERGLGAPRMNQEGSQRATRRRLTVSFTEHVVPAGAGPDTSLVTWTMSLNFYDDPATKCHCSHFTNEETQPDRCWDVSTATSGLGGWAQCCLIQTSAWGVCGIRKILHAFGCPSPASRLCVHLCAKNK